MTREKPGRRDPGDRGPRILATAWRAWEQVDPPFEGGSPLLPEVLFALLSLPPDSIEVRELPGRSGSWRVLKGTVSGVRLRILGQVDAAGRWTHVHDVHWLSPE